MGFLDNYILAIATATLIIQIVVLALLIFGYRLKRQTKFRPHGFIMATALILHAIVIAIVMIPVFALIIRSPHLLSFNPAVITGIIHGTLGVITLVSGGFLVASWRFKKNVTPCFKNKKIMRWTMVIWVTTLVLGIILYYLLYVASVAI
jgi:uncharacterized membrane protein YozB (DUF420 family)